MSETTTIPPQEPEIKEEVTLESLAFRLDSLGEQMNWLCDNLAALFGFVNQMGAEGGGIRGLMKAMKQTPELSEMGEGNND